MELLHKLVPTEVAWAGGLFDGEGCFTVSKHGYMQLGMSDVDSVQRFQRAIGGFGKIYLRKRSHIPLTGRKGGFQRDMWYWHVFEFEAVQAIIAMLWPYLNERRKAKAKALLTAIRVYYEKRSAARAAKPYHPWRLNYKRMRANVAY